MIQHEISYHRKYPSLLFSILYTAQHLTAQHVVSMAAVIILSIALIGLSIEGHPCSKAAIAPRPEKKVADLLPTSKNSGRPHRAATQRSNLVFFTAKSCSITIVFPDLRGRGYL
jgi:hypothetical protein